MRIRWYILSRLLEAFIATMAVLFGVMLIVQWMRIGRAVTLRDVDILLLTFVPMSSFVIPMALIFSILIVLERFSVESEIIAMKSCGVHSATIFTPILFLASFCLLVHVAVSTHLGPLTMKKIQTDLAREAPKKVLAFLEERDFNDMFKDVVIYVESVNQKEKQLKGIFIESSGKERAVITAENGTIDAQAGPITMRLHQGTVFMDTPRADRLLSFDEYAFTLEADLAGELRIKGYDTATQSEFRRLMEKDRTPRGSRSTIPGMPSDVQPHPGSGGHQLRDPAPPIAPAYRVHHRDRHDPGLLPGVRPCGPSGQVGCHGSGARGLGSQHSLRRRAEPGVAAAGICSGGQGMTDTLSRYIFRRASMMSLAAWAGLTLLVFVSVFLGNLSLFADHDAPGSVIARFMWYSLPRIAHWVLPFSVCIGVVAAQASFSRHVETIAMQACSVSFWRLSMPYIAVSLIAALIMGSLSFAVYPVAQRQAEKIERSPSRRRASRGPFRERRQIKVGGTSTISRCWISPRHHAEHHGYRTTSGRLSSIIRAGIASWDGAAWKTDRMEVMRLAGSSLPSLRDRVPCRWPSPLLISSLEAQDRHPHLQELFEYRAHLQQTASGP
jgi:lipopolysaccharide export LptBFGC system permease protein LptF